MKTTNKIYVDTCKGKKQAIKIKTSQKENRFYFPHGIENTASFEYNGKIVSGFIKTHPLKKTVKKKCEQKKNYETDFKIPEGLTFDEFGDYSISENKYVHKIKTIKRPKARKARINIKIENAVQTNAYNGAMYANAMIETITQSKKNSNKRKQKRK